MNKETLKIVSNETINALQDINIVTPTIYASIFAENASTYHADVEDEEKVTNTLLDDKIKISSLLQQKNEVNLSTLSANTDKAISAIKDKDEVTLAYVLQETNNLRKEIEKLKEAVYKDELTNVYNRKWMHDKFLSAYDDDNDPFKKSGTLAIIDLNFFKIINDTHGHVVGDKVLIFIANQLKMTKESVVRYGGDEFIILFSKDIDQSVAFDKLNHIREKIISKKLKAGEAAFRVCYSIGTQSFNEGDSLSETIELADKNMYTDKVQIKERVSGID